MNKSFFNKSMYLTVKIKSMFVQNYTFSFDSILGKNAIFDSRC